MIAISKILVPTDFSQSSQTALLYGKNFARSYGATLHILHVVDDVVGRLTVPPGEFPNLGKVQVELEAEGHRRLEAVVTPEDQRALKARTILLVSPRPAHAILSYAKDEGIDLIILGTHGRTGLAHLFMGSVAERVVRLAACPVLTVRHPEREITRPDALEVVAHR